MINYFSYNNCKTNIRSFCDVTKTDEWKKDENKFVYFRDLSVLGCDNGGIILTGSSVFELISHLEKTMDRTFYTTLSDNKYTIRDKHEIFGTITTKKAFLCA